MSSYPQFYPRRSEAAHERGSSEMQHEEPRCARVKLRERRVVRYAVYFAVTAASLAWSAPSNVK